MADLRVTMTASEYKALQAVRRFGAETRKEIEKTNKASSASAKKHSKGWETANKNITGGLKSLIGMLGLAGGVAGAVSTIIARVEKWRSTMDQIAISSAQAGREVTALALMQDPGMAGTAMEKALRIGVANRFSPGQAFSILQSLQAQTGTLDKGAAAFKAVGKLTLAQVQPEIAGSAVSTLMGLGIKPDVAARLLYATGEKSALDPGRISQAIPSGLPSFTAREGGILGGMTMMAKLSQVFQERAKVLCGSGGFCLYRRYQEL